MIHQLIPLWLKGWRSIFEVILLSVVIYYGYLYFRGTRGAKVLTGLAIVFLTLTLISTLLNLVVIGWIVRSFSVFLAVALVVIFQPELRRALAELGITEESDDIAIVISEETGGISICHRRRIERNFTPETFRQRISEILLHGTYEETDSEKLAGEVDLAAARDHALVPDQKERSDDALTV